MGRAWMSMLKDRQLLAAWACSLARLGCAWVWGLQGNCSTGRAGVSTLKDRQPLVARACSLTRLGRASF
ncbi:hypothetical protein JCGZ_10394 [Jatropha curcas]|uniref:Uncharacterized protein n=1 Tax=Jatropha curcas TaxID=180498 RepID=A0A067KT03_JATCU|nr:hypothetical protein JCGZ_10394 [Jatropha curcas]